MVGDEVTARGATTARAVPGGTLSVDRMPAHWLMARLGKRVLRPGGREATRWLLERARVGPTDDVIELAPGLGATARVLLAKGPRSYVAVERDAAAVSATAEVIADAGAVEARVVKADASRTGVADHGASIVIGEAMLSMQPPRHKQAIIREAARVLRPEGRYLLHELAVVPEDIAPALHAQLERDLGASIHVGVRIGTPRQWREWLEAEGFALEEVRLLPMRLLEVDRLIQDEGLAGTARFAWNVLRTPGALTRMRAVRASFYAHSHRLRAIAMVARRLPT